MTQASNQVKLPPISSMKSQSGPFKIPNDNEMLLENSRQGPSKQKQKIWDKATASCRTALKRFDKFQTAIDDRYVPNTSFNHKQKKMIENALQIIQNRKKNKDLASKNETIVDILQQKKQMFLVTMTHNIIDKEINNLKGQANERERGLKQSNQILEQDISNFQQYQEKYKNETKKIQQQFQKQVQKRLGKQQEIKSKQITVNSLRAEKARNQESISSYLKYKRFLDQLPPKQWIEQKQDKKSTKLKFLKEKMKEEYFNDDSNRKKPASQFEKHYKSVIDSGENEQIEQILNNQEMYFTDPKQLIQYFNTLEQKNLFCIQNAQYAEQKYQELKVRSEQKKKQLSEKYEVHAQQKKQLERQLQELESQVKMLKKKKDQNNVIDQKNNRDIKTTITQQYQHLKDYMLKEELAHHLPDNQNNTETLTLLSGIQILMEKLWTKLIACYQENPKVIKQIKNALQKNKNAAKREQSSKLKKLQDEKKKMRDMQKKAPVQKIPGRVDMMRSAPRDKLVVKKVQNTGKDMDDDRKYLIQ